MFFHYASSIILIDFMEMSYACFDDSEEQLHEEKNGSIRSCKMTKIIVDGSARRENGHPDYYLLRILCAEITALAISAIGFMGIKIPYSSPTDVLLTLSLGGCDGFGAPQFLCSYHMNTLFTYLLSLIQRVTGAFNIFGAALIILFTLSFCLMQAAASDRSPFAHLMAAVLQVLCLCYFTYTVVAYVSMGAGILCRAWVERKRLLYQKRAGRRGDHAIVFCSWILMLSGASLRYDVIISVLVLLLPTLLFHLVMKRYTAKDRRQDSKEKTTFTNAVSGLFIMFAAAAMLWIVISKVTNPLMFRSQGKEWEAYYTYDEQSLRIRDGQPIGYDAYKDVMDEVGWSENDLEMALLWLSSDLDVFGTKNLKKVADAVRLTDQWNLDLPDLLGKMAGTPMAAGFLAVCILAIGISIRRFYSSKSSGDPMGGKRKWRLHILALAALVPCALWGALYVRQRFVDRVAVPFLVLGILQFTELFELTLRPSGQNTVKRQDKAEHSAAAAIIVLLFCAVVTLKLHAPAWEPLSDSDRLSFRMYLEEHNEEAFLTAAGVLNRMNRDIPITEVSAEADYANTIRIGSQLSFSGSYYERCRRLMIPDPDHLMKNLIIGERPVRLITSVKGDAEKIRIFLEEHYGYTGEYTALDEILPGVIVYGFQ